VSLPDVRGIVEHRIACGQEGVIGPAHKVFRQEEPMPDELPIMAQHG
jgi:hypothetical protein